MEKSVEKQLKMIATAMSLKEEEKEELRTKLQEELSKKLASLRS